MNSEGAVALYSDVWSGVSRTNGPGWDRRDVRYAFRYACERLRVPPVGLGTGVVKVKPQYPHPVPAGVGDEHKATIGCLTPAPPRSPRAVASFTPTSSSTPPTAPCHWSCARYPPSSAMANCWPSSSGVSVRGLVAIQAVVAR